MPDNFVTKKTRSLRHHCCRCYGALKKHCLNKGHIDVCVAITADGRLCGETFTVKSQGCRSHPYADGHNVSVKNGTRNYTLRWLKEYLCGNEPNEAAGRQIAPDTDVLMTNGQARKHKGEKA